MKPNPEDPEQEALEEEGKAMDDAPDDEEDDDSSSSSDDDDDDLGLEGTLIRNPDVDDWSEEEEEEDDQEEEEDKKPASKGSAATAAASRKRPRQDSQMPPPPKRKAQPRQQEPDTTQVEFSFCDMDKRFFHGIKALLHGSSTVYQKDSSALADLMIDNEAVGTVVSDESGGMGEDPYVFGFGSVLNLTEHKAVPVIGDLKKMCLAHCPAEHQEEFKVVLSGQTKRPAGFYFHSRMINMPMEIVQVLHQQLVLDMDWAVEHAEGGPEARKECDYGAFVRLAPCQKEGGGGAIVYRYFDDEIFAGRAEFQFIMEAPKSYSKEEKQFVNVIVMTKTGHRDAMKDLDRMIKGT